MDTVINSITNDHLKLMLCFVLAVLSFIKLNEINNQKTSIKAKKQMEINKQKYKNQ